MKKKLVLSFFLFVCGIVFSQETFVSDINLYQDISQSFENRYYPKTIEKVDLLNKLYPDSVFIQSGLFYKARSLINLGHYEMAIKTLQDAMSHMHTGKDDFTVCHYLLGKSYFYLENYKEAVNSFYTATKLAVISNQTECYNYSIYYSAESLFNLNEYKKAEPLYEYVIENGNFYPKDVYEQSIINLVNTYSKNKNYEKTIDLYKSLNDKYDSISENAYFTLMFYAASAYENENSYNKAYSVYCDIAEAGNEKYSLAALKKIYNLNKSNKINKNLADILLSVSPDFDNDNETINELWIRLGIDEYNNKNYKKSNEYLSYVSKDFNIVNIYKAKIILDTDFSPEGGEKAELILANCKNLDENNIKVVENLSDSYYSVLMQSQVQQEKWDNIPDLFNKIENPDEKAVYINSAYYYRKGQFDKVSPKTGTLYTSALCKSGKYEEAVAVFADLDKNNLLSDSDLMEYGKVLFILEKYNEGYSVVSRSNDLQKDYLCGLFKINMENLEDARNHFMSYIKKASNTEYFNELAFYYKGYIEYGLKEYRNAYASFVRFISEADNKYFRYKRLSYKYASISALENNNPENAVFQAYNFLKTAESESEKIEGVRFCFTVLNDCELYDEAIDLLNPYINEKNDFTPEALYKTGLVYERQGKSELADKTFNDIYIDYPESGFAESSLYRSSEIYYFEENYYLAYKKFNEYVYKYPDGKFSDAALYFSGDCALRLGEINKAIMINKNMISKFPESKYTYSANKNLIYAYYEHEEYENALEIALYLLNKYEDQAVLDRIDIKANELERIVKGTDRRIAEKISEYEIAGKTETIEGRRIGSELVRLYAADSYMQEDGYNLAVELLESQKEDEELPYAAENAEFAGDYCRENSKNKEAAKHYLLAAQYYRSLQNASRAASSLYSAAEAFAVENMTGDAKETADLLKKLYPESKYAEQVDRIVR